MESNQNQDYTQDPGLQTAIEKIQAAIPQLTAIYLFGSYGTEFERKESDLDLAFLSKETVNSVVIWNLAQDIASAINRDVDLVDLQEASTVFRYQILTTGKLINCKDENYTAFFDLTSISMYLRFQEERKEIIQDYQNGDMNYG